ncbi:hypothetical protein BGS_0397 [Beggiatoa sp. SS]|nr:hypothetical protein BGS_0397 [Beggiatoa sp. SS]
MLLGELCVEKELQQFGRRNTKEIPLSSSVGWVISKI